MSLLGKEPIVVEYHLINGSHFFVAPDGCELAAGLCVGSRNLKEAFDQVGPALQYLLKANHRIEVKCKPELPYGEFLRRVLESIEDDLTRGGVDVSSDHARLHDFGERACLWTTNSASPAPFCPAT